MRLVLRWIKDCGGATAIEYGLIAAGVALTILLAVTTFGDTLYTLFYEDLIGALDGE